MTLPKCRLPTRVWPATRCWILRFLMMAQLFATLPESVVPDLFHIIDTRSRFFGIVPQPLNPGRRTLQFCMCGFEVAHYLFCPFCLYFMCRILAFVYIYTLIKAAHAIFGSRTNVGDLQELSNVVAFPLSSYRVSVPPRYI